MVGKDFFLSKATWGAIILLLTPFLNSIKVDPNTTLDAVMNVVQNGDALVGALLFLWGQFKRTEPITSVLGVKLGKLGGGQ